MKKGIIFSASCILLLFIVFAQEAHAEIITILGQQVDTGSINGFIAIAIIFSRWLLGITGSLALLAFVYGGFVFLLSGGSAQNVEKGKNILKAAVIGLVIVFASYSIIQFVLQQADLVKDDGSFNNSEFNSSGNWNTPPPDVKPQNPLFN